MCCSLQLTSWLNQIGLATVGLNGDMGANLSTSRDFLELHERLNEDLKVSNLESLFVFRYVYKLLNGYVVVLSMCYHVAIIPNYTQIVLINMRSTVLALE